MKNNKKIREELKKHGMKQWELAKLMGVSEGTLCRRLREELPEDQQTAIIDKIKAAQV